MRKNEKEELIDLLKRIRQHFRPVEFDKMTLGDWKLLDDIISRKIIKMEKEIGRN